MVLAFTAEPLLARASVCVDGHCSAQRASLAAVSARRLSLSRSAGGRATLRRPRDVRHALTRGTVMTASSSSSAGASPPSTAKQSSLDDKKNTGTDVDESAAGVVDSLTNASAAVPQAGAKATAEKERTTTRLRASEAREQLEHFTATFGRGKAVKKGLREEASKQFADLIAACGRSGLYMLGLDVYDRAVFVIGPDSELCASAVRAALSAKHPERALTIWQRARDGSIDMPPKLYSISVAGFVQCQLVDTALDFKRELERMGHTLELFAYNAIIEHYALGGELRRVLEVVEEVKARGLKVSHNTESLVLRAVYRSGLSLTGCLEWIEEQGYEKSRAALQAMLEESLAVNDRRGAEEVLELMRTTRTWARVRTYNAFIEYFAHNRSVDGAFRTFNALTNNGTVPTAHSYQLVVWAAIRSDARLDEARRLLDSAGPALLSTYNAFSAYAALAARCGEDACAVLLRMHEEGLAPDEACFREVFEAAAERRENDGAAAGLALYALMRQLGVGASRRTFNALLALLRNGGAAKDAVKLFRQMVEDSDAAKDGVLRAMDYSPDYETYELVLDACANGKRMDLAVGVFREIEERKVKPSVAMYSALVKGFGNSYDFESALGVWKEMRERGLRPNRTAYLRMVDACLQNPGAMVHAVSILDEMRAVGFSVEQDYYDTLIRGYGRARELGKLVDRFRGERDGVVGPAVDEVTLGAMLNACKNRPDDLPTVEMTIERLINSGLRPTRQVMDYLEDGKAVTRNKNKLFQSLFGLSGVDIVREYLPKPKSEDYREFKSLLDGGLQSPSALGDDGKELVDDKLRPAKSEKEQQQEERARMLRIAIERPASHRDGRKRVVKRKR